MLKMTETTGLSKKARLLAIGVLFLLPFVALEISSVFIYNGKFTDKEKLYLKSLMGLAQAYSPSEISFYAPHHYMIYTLNSNAMGYYQNFFGSKPEYYINSLGYRGKDFSIKKPPGVFRIVCIGSSTTFGLHEPDEAQTYPQLLEDELNRTYKAPRFEVINAGTPGWTVAECLINLQFRVLELSPDMIIVYEGVNETFAMRRDDEGKSDYSNFRQALSYTKPGPLETFFCRYSAFYRLYFVSTHSVSLDICNLITKPKPSVTDEDKNLDNATGKYFRRNMENIVAIAKAHSITPVLMTMGHGPWHHSLALNNQITRDITVKTGARLVDFEKAARPSYFLNDNVHLQRSGNQALVKTVLNAFADADFNFVK
jgi:lysophospholipase L1-like esterase